MLPRAQLASPARRLAAIVALATGSTASLALPALAEQRAINLTAASLVVAGNATVAGVPIEFPEVGIGSVYIPFVLPPDYKPDTPVTVRAYMQSTGASCTAHFEIGIASRRRAGLAPYANFAPSIDRVEPSDGTPLVTFPATADVVRVKSFAVRTPQSPTRPFSGQLVGDALFIRLDRQPAAVTDTCTGSIYLSHVEVRYTAQPPAP